MQKLASKRCTTESMKYRRDKPGAHAIPAVSRLKLILSIVSGSHTSARQKLLPAVLRSRAKPDIISVNTLLSALAGAGNSVSSVH